MTCTYNNPVAEYDIRPEDTHIIETMLGIIATMWDKTDPKLLTPEGRELVEVRAYSLLHAHSFLIV
jgi:hypothetical protein